MVVEIALRGVSAVAFAQNGGYQLLGGGFTVGAGDGEHGYLELTAVIGGKLLHGLQHIVNQYTTVVEAVLRIVDNAVRRTFGESLRNEGVAVESGALEREEHSPLAYLTGVRSYRAAFAKQVVNFFNIHISSTYIKSMFEHTTAKVRFFFRIF